MVAITTRLRQRASTHTSGVVPGERARLGRHPTKAGRSSDTQAGGLGPSSRGHATTSSA